jgi:hypothetical protein
MESEEELYEFLRQSVLPLSASSNSEDIETFLSSGGIPLILQVLDHENTDIAVSCGIQLLKELTDEEMPHQKRVASILAENQVTNFILRIL